MTGFVSSAQEADTHREAETAVVSGHTPGRWLAAAKPSSVVGWPVVSTPSGRLICDVSYVAMPNQAAVIQAWFDEAQANARLIAAAPEMLEALQTLSRTSPSTTANAVVVAARAAIAKATGEA